MSDSTSTPTPTPTPAPATPLVQNVLVLPPRITLIIGALPSTPLYSIGEAIALRFPDMDRDAIYILHTRDQVSRALQTFLEPIDINEAPTAAPDSIIGTTFSRQQIVDNISAGIPDALLGHCLGALVNASWSNDFRFICLMQTHAAGLGFLEEIQKQLGDTTRRSVKTFHLSVSLRFPPTPNYWPTPYYSLLYSSGGAPGEMHVADFLYDLCAKEAGA